MEKIKENEKDFKPIIVYIAWIFFSGILSIALSKLISNEALYTAVALCVQYVVLFAILFFMYHKTFINDMKKILYKRIIIFTILGIIFYFLGEFILNTFYSNIQNEETIKMALENYFWISFIPIAFFGPICEEIVFRYSFSTFIKNKVLFAIISSAAFSAMHVGGLGTGFILYFILGLILALIYLKSDKNLAASSTTHVVNNFIECILMLF